MNATAAIQAASAMPVNNSFTSAHKPTTLFQNRKVSRLSIFPQNPQAACCFVLLLFCLKCNG
jgi:hypothetical protein